MHEEEQYKQKCYQNQCVEDPKHKFIKVQTISNLNCEEKELFNNEKDHVTEHVTNHMYETIDEYSGYENCQQEHVKLTHSIERREVKHTKKSVVL